MVYNKIDFDVSVGFKKLLIVLRFLVLAILSFLLLEPLIKSWKNVSEKPIIILAHDNSQSIKSIGDTTFLITQHIPNWKKLSEKLSEKYQVESIVFGDKIKYTDSITFADKETNISEVFKELSGGYLNRNLAALVLATDGIYNTGENPENLTYPTPVYTVGLGDTIFRRDLSIIKLNYNPLTYKGNTFPVEVYVKGTKCLGCKSLVAIYNGNKKIAEQALVINGDNSVQVLNFLVKADESGMLNLTVKVLPISNEISLFNNTFSFFVEVIEARDKILLLANSPHPDINALKQALEENINLTVETYLLSRFNKNIKDYNLIILHQIPSVQGTDISIIEQIKKTDIPVLYICGVQTNYVLLSQFSGYTFTGIKPMPNDVTPLLDESFGLFTLEENSIKTLLKFPPLAAVYGSYNSKQEAYVFLRQQMGSVKTNLPLISFTDFNNRKEGFVFGEGLWRWRLHDYLQNENHTTFNTVVNKIVQYLSVKKDRNRFKVRIPNRIFNENDEIEFYADYFNESFEPVNTFDASIKILNESGKDFSYTFLKEDNRYYLNIGQLPPGNYTYTATVNCGVNMFSDRGSFVVKALQVETQDLTANHALLRNIAYKSGAMFYTANQLQLLEQELLNKNNRKPIIHTERTYTDLINWPYIFILLLLIITTEWFIRKFYGGY